MAEATKVALFGLGRIGGQFAERVREARLHGKPVEIVAVAERDKSSALAKAFYDDGTPVYTDAVEALDHTKDIDVIFDLTGVPEVRAAIRKKLHESGNTRTVVAPESVVRFFWMLFEDMNLPGPDRSGY